MVLRDRFWPGEIDFLLFEIVFVLARSILGFEERKTNSSFGGKKSGFVDSGFVKKMSFLLMASLISFHFESRLKLWFLLFKCDVPKALATRFE